MATLTGQQIDGSYQGLIKTTDNGAISGTAKAVTDGLGNATNIEISNTATNFVSGTVDFTGSTVSGLPAGSDTTYDLASAQDGANVDVTLTGSDATTDTVQLTAGTNITLTDNGSNSITIDAAGGGAAGLVSGTATDSMESASTLTTVAANAQGNADIVLGAEAESKVDASFGKNVVIGFNASHTGGEYSTIMGRNSTSSKGSAVVIGNDADNSSGSGIVIGSGASTGSLDEAMAIGLDASCTANAGGMAVGRQANAQGNSTTALGRGSLSKGTGSIAIGWNAKAQSAGGGDESVAIGFDAQGNNNGSIALGLSARGNADGAVALGGGVTAATADTVSLKALEVQTDSTPTAGGIIMSDAGGTDRRLNIDASGNLQVDSNVVGAASSFSLPRTAGTSSSGCDVIYSSVLIPGGTFAAGDILQLSGAMSASGSTSTIWSAYWISTNGTVGGSATEEVNCGQLALSDANWAVGFQKNLYVNVADGTGTGTELVTGMGYSDVDGAVNTSGADQKTPDWTSDLYLVNRSCIQAGNPVAYVDHGAVLKKIN